MPPEVWPSMLSQLFLGRSTHVSQTVDSPGTSTPCRLGMPVTGSLARDLPRYQVQNDFLPIQPYVTTLQNADCWQEKRHDVIGK